MADKLSSSHHGDSFLLHVSRMKTSKELARGEPRLRRLLAYLNIEDAMITELEDNSRKSNSAKSGDDISTGFERCRVPSILLSRPDTAGLSELRPNFKPPKTQRQQGQRFWEPRASTNDRAVSNDPLAGAGVMIPRPAILRAGDDSEDGGNDSFKSSQRWVHETDLQSAGVNGVGQDLRLFAREDGFQIVVDEVVDSDSDSDSDGSDDDLRSDDKCQMPNQPGRASMLQSVDYVTVAGPRHTVL